MKEYELDGARGEGRVAAVGNKLRGSLGGGRDTGTKNTARVREALRLKGKSERECPTEERKTHARYPAVRGECSSWLDADAGLLGVFIDLQGFNPQYWPKPLAEGC